MRGGQRWLMLLAASAIFILTAGAGWFEAADAAGFSLAILRRDGILFPFATYDGKSWQNPWPTPGKSVTVPIALADTPRSWWLDKKPVLEWTPFPLVRTRPQTINPLHVNAINYFRAGCTQAVGLFTDYKPSIVPPPPRVHPYPKDALAYAGDVKIEPIESVSTTDAVAKALLGKLTEEVTRKEDEMVERFTNHRWKHSYDKQERLETPIQLEALYRIPDRSQRGLYYYEAVKRYFLPKNTSPEKGARCDLVTFASGWIAGPMSRDVRLSTRVLVTSCDFQNVNFMLPLGSVWLGHGPKVIVQWSNATFESYMVMEVRPGHIERIENFPPRQAQQIEMFPLIETPGGACGGESDEERD
jgi:hypothetical protein